MKQCNICFNKKDFKTISKKIREGEGLILQCCNCKHIFQATDMNMSELENYYNDIYPITNNITNSLAEIEQEHKEKLDILKDISKLMIPYLKKDMNVLDVGAGSGAMLNLIENNVNKLYATELNKPYIDWMNNHNINATYGFYEKLDYKLKFDFIMSIESLEHMLNPIDILNKMNYDLKIGGKLFITVPNLNEALNCFLPEETQNKFNTFYWHKAHFSYFSEDTIRIALEKAGFKKINVTYHHRYTIVNFLNWYFKGERQNYMKEATENTNLFNGDSSFELKMNDLFNKLDIEFRELSSTTKRGDTMIIVAEK